jgi:flagella basal body P-ring formation protein FlgA
MHAAMLVLGLLAAGDAMVLREQARVGGRWVRLSDLLDAERSGPAARASAADVWLGRAPEGEARRVVTAAEIRRELERRGVDPSAFDVVGERVEVVAGIGPDADPSRAALAFEIKRHLIDQDPARAAEGLSVRVLSAHPEAWPAGMEPSAVRARGAGFAVAFVSPDGRTAEVLVDARVSRTRDVAFATREILPGKIIDRADLEFRRVECSGEEGYAAEEGLLGASATARIRKGAAVAAADVRLKPVLRRGEIVRASSSSYELDVRALADGVPGQVIDVEFLTSKRRVRARVAGAARVEVVEEGR